MEKQQKNTFDSVIDGVLEIEGGICKYSAYGIDNRTFPKEFNKAVELNRYHGEDVALNYARQFFKQEFWDKNDMDSIPHETRDIVFDAIVNHSKKFSGRLVAEASHGATRSDLLEMREAEYKRLAKAKRKYAGSLHGWLKRLDGFRENESGREIVELFSDENDKTAVQENQKIRQLAESYKNSDVLSGAVLGLIQPADYTILGDIPLLPAPSHPKLQNNKKKSPD